MIIALLQQSRQSGDSGLEIVVIFEFQESFLTKFQLEAFFWQ